MPKIYFVDLREKAMQFYKKLKTCELFNITRTTLDDWILLEQQTGQLEQPKSPNMGRPSCILDLQAFEAFVKTIPFTQAKDLVPLFALRFGYSVSYQVILGALNEWAGRVKKVFSTNKPAS
jgi:hypothetical protein